MLGVSVFSGLIHKNASLTKLLFTGCIRDNIQLHIPADNIRGGVDNG